MATPRRAKKKTVTALAPVRYATLVRTVRKFAATRVAVLEKEMASLERTARTGAAEYLHKVVKELRRFEAELARLEKMVAPPARKARPKARMKKPIPLPAVRAEAAA